MGERIAITGLRELRRELKAADAKFPKEIAALNKQLVNQLFVPAARANAAARANPRAGSRVLASIRGLGSQTRATIAGGSARVPWFAGHEWGSRGVIRGNSRRGQKGHTRMFPPRSPQRGRGNAGYILTPAVYENMPRALTAYGAMLDDLLRSAFPE